MTELETLQNGLQRLDKVLHNMTFDQARDILSDNLPRVPIPITDFDNSPFFFNQREYGGMNLVYRARPNEKGDTWASSNFTTVKELSYVPSDSLDKIKTHGRVNKPHEAIFYGAFDGSTAAIEILHANQAFIQSRSAFITISIWRFTQPLILADIPLSKRQHDALYEELAGVDGFKSKFDESYFKRQNEAKIALKYNELDNCVMDYFSDKFCESKEGNQHYKISNYYADRAFNRYPEIHPMPEGGVEGILYSSIAGSYQDRCIALLPDVVDTKLEFLEVQLVWARGHEKFELDVIDVARADENGKLVWQKGR